MQKSEMFDSEGALLNFSQLLCRGKYFLYFDKQLTIIGF